MVRALHLDLQKRGSEKGPVNLHAWVFRINTQVGSRARNVGKTTETGKIPAGERGVNPIQYTWGPHYLASNCFVQCMHNFCRSLFAEPCKFSSEGIVNLSDLSKYDGECSEDEDHTEVESVHDSDSNENISESEGELCVNEITKGKDGHIWSTKKRTKIGRPPARNIVLCLPGNRGVARNCKSEFEMWKLLLSDDIIEKNSLTYKSRNSSPVC